MSAMVRMQPAGAGARFSPWQPAMLGWTAGFGHKLQVDFCFAQLRNTMEIMSASPEKNFEVRTEVWEARNSLWVYSPSIWDAKNNNCIFSFEDEKWSADASVWNDDATVSLCL